MTPIAIHQLGLEAETGLNRSIIVTGINIRADIENIIVEYFILTYSPTGVVVRKEGPFNYFRYNDPSPNGKMAFDYWRNSQIGLDIANAVLNTIQNYPDLEQ